MSETTYAWRVHELERNAATGIVDVAHWDVVATEPDGLSARAYGTVELAPPDVETMIPYPDLDEFTVVTWVVNNLGQDNVEQVQEALKVEIEQQRNPVKVTGVPW